MLLSIKRAELLIYATTRMIPKKQYANWKKRLKRLYIIWIYLYDNLEKKTKLQGQESAEWAGGRGERGFDEKTFQSNRSILYLECDCDDTILNFVKVCWIYTEEGYILPFGSDISINLSLNKRSERMQILLFPPIIIHKSGHGDENNTNTIIPTVEMHTLAHTINIKHHSPARVQSLWNWIIFFLSSIIPPKRTYFPRSPFSAKKIIFDIFILCFNSQ